MTSIMLAAVMLGLLLGVPGPARAQYVFTPIDVPGAAATYANGSNTHEIAGEFDDQVGNTHGFVLRKGVFTQFDVPGAEGYTSINGINAHGEWSGIYFESERYYGYFWSEGVFTTLDPSGSSFSAALSLNERGEVLGYSFTFNATEHIGIWDHRGTFRTHFTEGTTQYPTLSGSLVFNDRDQIVITATTDGTSYIVPSVGERYDLPPLVTNLPAADNNQVPVVTDSMTTV
jgi:uncharacterized membrane protein